MPTRTEVWPRRPAASIRAMVRLTRMARALGLAAAMLVGPAALAAPFTPADDRQVLERLPARATDAAARDLVQLREAWRRDPGNEALAVRLARFCLDRLPTEGDPRLVGCAQAALAPWWQKSEPPLQILVLRAIVYQFSHRFDAALVDLDAALRQDPAALEAWLWRVAILMVQARYDEARGACASAARLAAVAGSPLIGEACTAQVEAATGQAAPAAARLREALQRHAQAAVTERVWALTRLAETEERLGRATAEATYREALALDGRDVYLLGAFADWLLDAGRPGEVRTLLAGRQQVDVLLLRLALAARRLGEPQADALQRELGARFDAARRRGDALHEKEEARFQLALAGDTARALELARRNFALQREPADARVLLEAALAARDKAAAEPVLQLLQRSRLESGRLHGLAQQIRALP